MKKILFWVMGGIIGFALGFFFAMLVEGRPSPASPAIPEPVAREMTEDDAMSEVTSAAMSYHTKKSVENLEAALKEVESMSRPPKRDR